MLEYIFGILAVTVNLKGDPYILFKDWKMYDETAAYMEPMGQQGLQGLSRPKTSRNSASTPSSQSLSRVAAATPSTGSRLGPYGMPSFLTTSPRSSTRHKADYFDVKESDKQDIRLAFELYDTRKVGRLCYRELKVIFKTIITISCVVFWLTHATSSV